MNNRSDIDNELGGNEDFRLGLSKQMPYQVPDDYFIHNPETFLDLAKNLESDEVIPDFGKRISFVVPDEYFERFPAIVGDRIKGALPASNTMPYMEVPHGYFAEFSGNLLKVVTQTEKSASRPLFIFPAFTFRKPARIAVAALLVIAIGFGTIRIMEAGNQSDPDKLLSGVSHNEISEFVQQNYADPEPDVVVNNPDLVALKFENNEIIQYLNETGWDNTD